MIINRGGGKGDHGKFFKIQRGEKKKGSVAHEGGGFEPFYQGKKGHGVLWELTQERPLFGGKERGREM